MWFKIGGGLAAISVLQFLYMVAVFVSYPTNYGHFGDMFGGLNAWFSGAALLGIVYALIQSQKAITQGRESIEQSQEVIVMQSEELALQREELGLQRQEMEKSSAALEGQVRLMAAAQVIQAHSNVLQGTMSVSSYAKYQREDLHKHAEESIAFIIDTLNK